MSLDKYYIILYNYQLLESSILQKKYQPKGGKIVKNYFDLGEGTPTEIEVGDRLILQYSTGGRGSAYFGIWLQKANSAFVYLDDQPYDPIIKIRLGEEDNFEKYVKVFAAFLRLGYSMLNDRIAIFIEE